MRRSIVASALVAILTFASWASAQRTCPTARVEEGSACTHEALTCSWRGTHEGARDTRCVCERGDDDQLHWRCQAVGHVYIE